MNRKIKRIIVITAVSATMGVNATAASAGITPTPFDPWDGGGIDPSPFEVVLPIEGGYVLPGTDVGFNPQPEPPGKLATPTLGY